MPIRRANLDEGGILTYFQSSGKCDGFVRLYVSVGTHLPETLKVLKAQERNIDMLPDKHPMLNPH